MLSKRTILVVNPMMNQRIEQRIGPIFVAPQMLLTPEMKEVVADAASRGAWVNRNPRQVRRTGVVGSTLGGMAHVVSVKHDPYPVLIGVASPPCGLNGSLQVANKQKSTSPAVVRNTPKLGAVFDG